MATTNAIPGFPSFGLRFAICTNAETLGVDNDTIPGLHGRYIVRDMASAAGQVIRDAGFDYDDDSIFQHWNGGMRSRFASIRDHRVCVYIARGDEPYGEWKYVRKSDVPADVIAAAEKVQHAAIAAMDAALEALKASRATAE